MLVGDRLTGWFPVLSGVRQGDSLSPTLFAVFINDLAEELNTLNRGINVCNQNISILMYADVVIILADTHDDVQAQLDIMRKWCATWGVISNIAKSQVVHHRNYQ